MQPIHTDGVRRSILFAVLVLACGSAPRARVASAIERRELDGALDAYEEFRRTQGGDVELLAPIAAMLLEREAQSDDAALREAALIQLSLAGTRGAPVLTRLARGSGPARLLALSALARRGQNEAKLELRALADTEDPTILAASILGMDSELDRELLLSLLDSSDRNVRRSAIEALTPAAASVRSALEQVARVDSEASVRASAVRALGRAGTDAIAILRERLGDPDPGVRFAAVGALISADPERGRIAIGPLLSVAPSPSGIEAARLLAQADDVPGSPVGAAQALAFLRRVLASDDPALRAQAGVAIASLPTDRRPPLDALRAALATENDSTVLLSFARALHRHDRQAAHATLRALLDAQDDMVRVQAAALLAADGDAAARRVLEGAASAGESMIRRTAVRALAREAMAPDAARRLLRDDDALVRIYAAGGILASAAASG